MKDIFEKIEKNMGPIGEHSKESHGYFTFPKLEGDINPHMNFRGKKLLNWSLNNYLGLAIILKFVRLTQMRLLNMV